MAKLGMTDMAGTPLRPVIAAQNRGPIERAPSLVDEITAQLQADILEGRLAPGQRISAAAVSRQLGVSHIPVREALRRLESGALVESTHHQGAAVSRISIDELHEIYDLRRLIEGDLARSAAALYGEDDMAAIIAAGERLMLTDPTDPAGSFWDAHRAFHRANLAPAMNPTVARVLGMLWQSGSGTPIFGRSSSARLPRRPVTIPASSRWCFGGTRTCSSRRSWPIHQDREDGDRRVPPGHPRTAPGPGRRP